MKISVLIFIAVTLIFYSCNSKNGRDKDLDNIKKIEAQTFSPKITKLDQKLAGELILAYEDFSKKYPQDSLAPQFLFKAGEVSMSTNQGGKAIQYFDNFLTTYPDKPKTPHCLFLQAFVYETQLKDLPNAKRKYEEFINRYPKHELVKDAVASIEMLGKSPEEIIKSFEEKNNQAKKAEEKALGVK